MVVFAAHWQWVSKWSIQSVQRLHFLGIRHTCLTSTIFPCPSKLCFSIQAQGATPPRFHGPFFPRESQEVVGGMNCRRHGCCVPWGCSWYSSSPLPTTHSKLPSSWSVVPVVDCGLSGGMIQTWTTWKLDSHILLVWEHCICWSTVTRQHQDTPTLITWLSLVSSQHPFYKSNVPSSCYYSCQYGDSSLCPRSWAQKYPGDSQNL